MRKSKLHRVRELAASGWTTRQIAEELDVRERSIRAALRDSGQSVPEPSASSEPSPSRPPPPLPPDLRKSLAGAARATRESLLMSVETLAAHLRWLDSLMERAVGLRSDGTVDSECAEWGHIKELSIARAVTVDKQAEVLRQLRALESESAESIEMAFTIVEELPDGTRRVVGQAPELAAALPPGIEVDAEDSGD